VPSCLESRQDHFGNQQALKEDLMTHPLDAGMPPCLILADAGGSMRYGVTFEHGFGSDHRGQVVAPFTWRPGPPGVPTASALKLTDSVAAALSTMPPAARWDRIHSVLQNKYGGDGAFIPSDGRLTIALPDLAEPAMRP
jgi:hypothetical protein